MKRLIENNDILSLVKRKQIDGKTTVISKDNKTEKPEFSEVKDLGQVELQKKPKKKVRRVPKHLKFILNDTEASNIDIEEKEDEKSEERVQDGSRRQILYLQGIEQQKKKEELIQQKMKEEQQELVKNKFKATGIIKFKAIPLKEVKDLTVPVSPKLGIKNKSINENLKKIQKNSTKVDISKEKEEK